MDDDKIVCGSTRLTLQEILEAARPRGIRFTEARKAYGSPRSVVSNTHGFRIAVHRITGEIRILYSVQATDAGGDHQSGAGAGDRSKVASPRASASHSPRTST